MKIIPHRFKAMYWHLLWQPLAAVVYIGLVLVALGHTSGSDILWAVGVGALSSSCYIVFITPKSTSAEPRRIIGGYIIGIISGMVMHVLLSLVEKNIMSHNNFNNHLFWASAAITVGVAMLLMLIFNVEHPPAVGVSVVLVLEIHHYSIVGVILVAVMLLTILKRMLDPWLVNLVVRNV